MRRSLGRCPCRIVAIALAAILSQSAVSDSAQEGNSRAAQEDPKKPTGETPPKPLTADKLKLPPGAIFIVCEELKDSLALFPKFVMIRPDKLNELMDRISQLERLVKAEKKLPHTCKLAAVAVGDHVEIQANFEFETEEPRTIVFLGCRGAQVRDATLKSGNSDSGGVPFLEQTGEGYEVLVPKSGRHFVTLRLKLPALSGTKTGALGGGERTFDLGLPGAAVTTLTLQLPDAVTELVWNKNIEKSHVPEKKQTHWELVLGKISNLSLSWREPVRLPGAQPLPTAQGQIVVKVEENRIQTTAELTLQDLRNQAKEWRLWLPPKAKVKVIAPDAMPFKIAPSGNNIHVLTLEEPSAKPIKILVTVEQTRGLLRIPIGPYAVLDAHQQSGTIEVRAPLTARRGVQLAFYFNDEVEQREIAKDVGPDIFAAFRYVGLPTPGKPNPPTGSKSPGTGAALELELKPAKGRVETTVLHDVRIRPHESQLHLFVTSKIEVHPLYAPVDFVDVQLPRLRWDSLMMLSGLHSLGFPDQMPWASAFLHAATPTSTDWNLSGGVAAELLFPDTASKLQRKARIKLNDFHSNKFTVELSSIYRLPATMQRVRLELPRPVAILDRGGTVKVDIDDNRELLVREGAFELPAPERQRVATKWDQAPSSVELAWRPFRPEFPVQSVADITLHDRHVHVQQLITLPAVEKQSAGKSAALKARPLALRVSPAIKALNLGEGYTLLSHNREQQIAWVTATAPAAPLMLDYDVSLPQRPSDSPNPTKEDPTEPEAATSTFLVPLVWVDQATRVETKVRFWGDPGLVPRIPSPQDEDAIWKDVGTEVVAGRDSLPLGVFRSQGFEVPLRVELEAAPPLLAGVVIDKALIQVTIPEDGTEHYRARFRLDKLQTDHLDIRLPAPPSGLFLNVAVDDKKVAWRLLEAGGRVVRVPLEPSLYKQPVLLEVTYQLSRGQPESESLWQTVLFPPELLGNVYLGVVRWQVQMPTHWVPVLWDGSATTEQQWGWRGWLPAPEAGLSSAELETWLTARAATDTSRVPSLVCNRATLEPLYLFRMPQQIWLLLCSGTLLLVGLGLNFAPLPTPVYWCAIMVVGLGLIATGYFLPSILPAVLYGCLPGTAVLFAVAGLQWVLQRRYRRQLLFMPSFTRAKAGSSLSRISRVTRTREASTVDAPPVTGSAGSVRTAEAEPSASAGT